MLMETGTQWRGFCPNSSRSRPGSWCSAQPKQCR